MIYTNANSFIIFGGSTNSFNSPTNSSWKYYFTPYSEMTITTNYFYSNPLENASSNNSITIASVLGSIGSLIFAIVAVCFVCAKLGCSVETQFKILLAILLVILQMILVTSPFLLMEQIVTVLVVNELENNSTWFPVGITISCVLVIEDLVYEIFTFVDEEHEWIKFTPFALNGISNLVQFIVVIIAHKKIGISTALTVLFCILQVIEIGLKLGVYFYQKVAHREEIRPEESPQLYALKIVLMIFYLLLGFFFLIAEGIQDPFYSSNTINIYFIVCLHISKNFFSIEVTQNLIYLGCFPIQSTFTKIDIPDTWKSFLGFVWAFTIYFVLVYLVVFIMGFYAPEAHLIIFNGILFGVMCLIVIFASCAYCCFPNK